MIDVRKDFGIARCVEFGAPDLDVLNKRRIQGGVQKKINAETWGCLISRIASNVKKAHTNNRTN